MHDGGIAVGAALVTDPHIKAVGFTGSLRGGRPLFDLCAARAEPIPFFGELGSVNPMFVMPHALAARGADIAQGWAAPLTMGAGQFCTNPGIAIVTAGDAADASCETMAKALRETAPQTMLTGGIFAAFQDGLETIAQTKDVTPIIRHANGERQAAPQLFRVDAATFAANPTPAHEVFGPFELVVTVEQSGDMPALARRLEGQRTATLHLDRADQDAGDALLRILERKARRVLVNGFPTGVEVADAMVHGGPYPASTSFGATSVGTMAIRRFLRPVCYQNLPAGMADWVTD